MHRVAGRIVAALLLLVFSPLLLLIVAAVAIFRRGPLFSYRPSVRLPAAGDPDRWETFSLPALTSGVAASAAAHFALCFLPGLPSVVMGRLALVGVPARTREEVEALPADWRAMYLRSRVGLVQEAFVQHGSGATADDRYAAEIFYSVSAGVRLDASILLRYAGRIFGLGSRKLRSRAVTGGAS